MKRHIAASDFDPKKSKGFRNKKKSMTIPDLSMTIPEMLDRFARGLPINGERMPVYQMGNDDNNNETGDTTFYPDVQNMDFAEAEAYMEATKKNYEEVRAKYEKENKLMAQRKREARQKVAKQKYEEKMLENLKKQQPKEEPK